MSSAFGNLADWGLDDGGGVGASADAFAPPATVTDARVDGGGGGGIFGRRKKHVDLAFAVDKPIQLDPTLAAAAGAPLPQNSAVRQLDEGQYPGGEFFNTQVAFYVIDGFTPDAKTTTAAGKLQKLMQCAATVGQALDALDKAVVQLGTNVGELGTQLTALLTPGDTLPAAVAAAQQNSLAMWQRNVTSLKTHVISVNAEVAKMQQAAADRQAKFMQFETLRQDILANLRKPMKGVGAAGKMLKKEEAFQAADTQFKAAEAGLVSFVEAKEAPTAAAYGKALNGATQLLAQFYSAWAASLSAVAPPPPPPKAPPRVYRVVREAGAGLGLVLKTNGSNFAFVQSATGAAAAAGIVPGLLIVAVNDQNVAQRGEGAVVQVIRSLPPNAPVDFTLVPP